MWLAVARHVVPTFGCGAGMDVWMPFGMNCAMDLLIGDRTNCVRGQKWLEGDTRDRVFEALASIMLSSFLSLVARSNVVFFVESLFFHRPCSFLRMGLSNGRMTCGA